MEEVFELAARTENLDPKFRWKVPLPRHSNQPHRSLYGDPRRAWCYDCLEPSSFTSRTIYTNERGGVLSNFSHQTEYYFVNETDALMFLLRWS